MSIDKAGEMSTSANVNWQGGSRDKVLERNRSSIVDGRSQERDVVRIRRSDRASGEHKEEKEKAPAVVGEQVEENCSSTSSKEEFELRNEPSGERFKSEKREKKDPVEKLLDKMYSEQSAAAKEAEERARLPPAVLMQFAPEGTIIREFADEIDFSEHLTAGKSTDGEAGNRLYTLRSLPLKYLQLFRAHLNLDREIADAHAARDSHQLLHSSRLGAAAPVRVFALNHVDVIQSPRTRAIFGTGGRHFLKGYNDLMGQAERVSFRSPKKERGWEKRWNEHVLFCHVTLVGRRDSDGRETCR